MKVLLDALQATNRSGTGTYASALVRNLPETLPDGEVAVAWPTASALPESIPATSVYPCTERSAPLGTVLRSVEMLRALRRFRPDIVHYPANFSRWAGKGGTSAKVVLTVHDLSFLRQPAWFRWDRATYYRAMIGRSVARADLLLADSHATSRDLQEFLGVSAERIVVTHLGVDESYRAADAESVARVRRALSLPNRFFLYLGTLEPRKNLPRVIQAFDSVADNVEQDLVIAGRAGWKTESTFRAVSSAIHKDRIHLPGFVDAKDMCALLSAADVFVWPSLWEGFGLPPLEAMACGTPVLTSNTSSLPEVVGEAAITVDPEDVDAIAGGMNHLGNDGMLRESLSVAGRNRAGQFTWQRTAEQTVSAYRKVLGV